MDEAEQFKELIELHKFYFEFLLTGTTFYLGIVGGLFAYVVKSGLRGNQLRAVLVVPFLLCVAMTVFYVVGYFKLTELHEWVSFVQHSLGVAWRPHTELLPAASVALAVISGFVSLAVLITLLRPGIIPKASISTE